MLWLYPTHIVALVDSPGRYEVRVRWSPYWRASTGCVWRGPDGMLRLLAPHAGLVDLRRVGERHPRPRDAHRADPPPGVREVSAVPSSMIEDGKPLADQLSELGAQLDWVREYL